MTANNCIFDIHAHILPGVDDGASNTEMALAMLEMYQQQGVTHIAVTPHYQRFVYDTEYAWTAFDRFRQLAAERYPGIHLIRGAEVLFDETNIRSNVRLLNDGVLPSYNHTRYVLTEFFPDARQHEASKTLDALLADNWIPVVAHAERIRKCFLDESFTRHCIDKGALIQINAYSLVKEQNPLTKMAARALLHAGMVHFIGSDAHRTNHRPPDVSDGISYIRQHCSNAEDILYNNAATRFLKK